LQSASEFHFKTRAEKSRAFVCVRHLYEPLRMYEQRHLYARLYLYARRHAYELRHLYARIAYMLGGFF